MSDATKSAVEDAIRAHLAADRDGDILTDWVVLAATYLPGDEGANGYLRLVPDGQAIHSTLGLVEEARQALVATATASLIEEDDGE